jgi:hypothetical protein
VNDGQFGAVCPQCGDAAAVHSIGELAALARNQLGQQPGYAPPPQTGNDPPPQPGYPSSPSGFPPPTSYDSPPAGGFGAPPAPGYTGPPPPGYTGSARPGQPSRSGPSTNPSGPSRRSSDWPGLGDAADSVEEAVADVVMGAAMRFVGRKIGRRVQRAVSERVLPAVTERVLPAVAVRQEAMLREQIAIAERHPDLRACLTDQVIFLAGGQRVLPMPSLTGGFTVEQSDAVVARLRDG